MDDELPQRDDLDSLQFGDEIQFEHRPEGYIPPLNETVLIEQSTMDELQVILIDFNILTMVGLSKRDDLDAFVFEVELLSIDKETKTAGWKITKRTREDFSKNWDVPLKDLKIPNNIPKNPFKFRTKSPLLEMFDKGGRKSAYKTGKEEPED